MKILIIDDDEMVIKIIIGIISEKIDCQIITAMNGETGIKKFQKEKPDVVITDMEIQSLWCEMSGVDVIRAIKKENPEIKIILKSANFDYRELAEEEGVSFYWFNAMGQDDQFLVEQLKEVMVKK